jgi:hypothetical protein
VASRLRAPAGIKGREPGRGSFAGAAPSVAPAASSALALIISLGAAPCRDESRDRAGANRSLESFINGLVFTLKGLTLVR